MFFLTKNDVFLLNIDLFVELGGGVDDMLARCRDGAYVEFGSR